MKRILSILAALIALLTISVSCGPEPIEVSSVSLDKTSLDIPLGGTASLTATVDPGNADDPSVAWSSSDETVVSVSRSGSLSAKALGTATITAKAGTKSATCKVTVLPIEVEKVELDKTELKLVEGEIASLKATVSPSDATDAAVTWKSSDEKVATVDAEGTVTAIAVGSVTITAKAGDKSVSCAVTVLPAQITGIKIEPEAFTIKEGGTRQLTLSFTPASSSSPKAVDWVSDKTDIARVDANGLVTAVAPGETKIHVRLQSNHDVQAFCTVTVERDGTLRGISLNPAQLVIPVGKTKQVTVSYIPDYADNKTVSWTSADPSVAAVDAQGNVAAVAIGSTTVTATSAEGGLTAACEVTVSEAVPDIYLSIYSHNITLNNEELPDTYGHRQCITVGDDFYSFSDSKVLYKNGKQIADWKTFSIGYTPTDIYARNGKVYILANNSYNGFEAAVFVSDSEGNTQSHSWTADHNYAYESLAVAPSGVIYAIGSERDSFGEEVAMLVTVSTTGEVSKTKLTGIDTYFFDIEVDSEGNLYMVAPAKRNSTTLDLYKNGEFQYTLFTSVMHGSSLGNASEGVSIALSGSDVYVVNEGCHGNGTYEVSVYKNGDRIHNLSEDRANRYRLSCNIVATSEGNVYYALSKNESDSLAYLFIYKNDKVYYQMPCTNSVTCLAVRE